MKTRTMLEYGAEKPTRRGVLSVLAALIPAGLIARDATLRTTATRPLTGRPVSKPPVQHIVSGWHTADVVGDVFEIPDGSELFRSMHRTPPLQLSDEPWDCGVTPKRIRT